MKWVGPTLPPCPLGTPILLFLKQSINQSKCRKSYKSIILNFKYNQSLVHRQRKVGYLITEFSPPPKKGRFRRVLVSSSICRKKLSLIFIVVFFLLLGITKFFEPNQAIFGKKKFFSNTQFLCAYWRRNY